MAEQEMNLKLTSGTDLHIEHSVDGLLRADFKTRMEGYSKAIQSGVYKPNEARARENLPADPDGDKLVIQSNIAPIVQIGTQQSREGS